MNVIQNTILSYLCVYKDAASIWAYSVENIYTCGTLGVDLITSLLLRGSLSPPFHVLPNSGLHLKLWRKKIVKKYMSNSKKQLPNHFNAICPCFCSLVLAVLPFSKVYICYLLCCIKMMMDYFHWAGSILSLQVVYTVQ